MLNKEREVKLLVADNDAVPYEVWYNGIKDNTARAAIRARITRASAGNFGDHKYFRGIYELRIDHGPGYRVYFGIHEDRIIVLLGGSVKKGQQSAIDTAVALWEKYCDETERFR